MEIIPATKVDSTNAQELFLQLLGLKRADADRLHTERGVDLVRLIDHFSGVCNNLTMMSVLNTSFFNILNIFLYEDGPDYSRVDIGPKNHVNSVGQILLKIM